MKSNPPIELSPFEQEFLDGCLLGDGFLVGSNRTYQFRYSAQMLTHVDFVRQKLASISSKRNKEKLDYTEYKDKRTEKTYSRYTFCSQSNKTFKYQFDRWYPNKTKHIPADLTLTPTVCLMWYIGDGCLRQQKYSGYIKLATHCFEKTQLETLIIPQLKNFQARLSIANKKKQQYFIYIPRKHISDFLKYIGVCPIPEYQYKWDYILYSKYPNSQNHKNHKAKILIMHKDKKTQKEIADTLSVPYYTVHYYCHKHA
jgi:hypothetical protein